MKTAWTRSGFPGVPSPSRVLAFALEGEIFHDVAFDLAVVLPGFHAEWIEIRCQVSPAAKRVENAFAVSASVPDKRDGFSAVSHGAVVLALKNLLNLAGKFEIIGRQAAGTVGRQIDYHFIPGV